MKMALSWLEVHTSLKSTEHVQEVLDLNIVISVSLSPLTNWDSTEGKSPGPIIVISQHTTPLCPLSCFSILSSSGITTCNFQGLPRKKWLHISCNPVLPHRLPLPYDSFNHPVYHTVLHPCLPGHLISTMAYKTFALPTEGPLNFCGSCSPTELAGGLFWWKKNYSNKTSIFFFSCNCKKKKKSEKLVRIGGFGLTMSVSVSSATSNIQLLSSLWPHFLKTCTGDTTLSSVSQERRIKKEAKRKTQAPEPLWGAGSMLESIKWLPG